MDFTVAQIDARIVALLLALAMLASWAIGWMIGRKLPDDPEEKSAGRFVDASLALLGLLLGFSFAMALSKHDQRRLMVIADANGIADYYTVAGMLTDPQRKELRALVPPYMETHLALVSTPLNSAAAPKVIADAEKLQAQMTHMTEEIVRAGTPVTIPLITTLNALTSNHISLTAALRDRLPTTVLILLALTAVITTVLVGRYHGRKHTLQLSGTICYIALVSLVVWAIMDLNQPTRGFIRLSTEPLERVAAGLHD